MAEVERIIKGVDKEIEFTITDSAGVAIDPSSLIGIVIILYYNENNVLRKYSKNVKTGYGDVITGYDDVNGKVKVRLESSSTVNAKVNVLYAEIKLQTTNNDYENNTFNDVVNGILVGAVVDGVSKNNDDLS